MLYRHLTGILQASCPTGVEPACPYPASHRPLTPISCPCPRSPRCCAVRCGGAGPRSTSTPDFLSIFLRFLFQTQALSQYLRLLTTPIIVRLPSFPFNKAVFFPFSLSIVVPLFPPSIAQSPSPRIRVVLNLPEKNIPLLIPPPSLPTATTKSADPSINSQESCEVRRL